MNASIIDREISATSTFLAGLTACGRHFVHARLSLDAKRSSTPADALVRNPLEVSVGHSNALSTGVLLIRREGDQIRGWHGCCPISLMKTGGFPK
jgi:hypothetical protein